MIFELEASGMTSTIPSTTLVCSSTTMTAHGPVGMVKGNSVGNGARGSF